MYGYHISKQGGLSQNIDKEKLLKTESNMKII